jgi:hypothetical protein
MSAFDPKRTLQWALNEPHLNRYDADQRRPLYEKRNYV